MVLNMTMGTYIRMLREDHHMSQEELGNKLDPKVNRAAVNKWETGQVENIKRRHIEQMSKIFGVRPSELMCFGQTEDAISRETVVLENVQREFGKDAVRLLTYYLMLNKLGQTKSLESLEDLTALDKYKGETDV